MTTTAEHGYQAPGAFQRFSRQGAGSSVDLTVVSLWTAFGLAMTVLAFALGFGAEVGQALAVAG